MKNSSERFPNLYKQGQLSRNKPLRRGSRRIVVVLTPVLILLASFVFSASYLHNRYTKTTVPPSPQHVSDFSLSLGDEIPYDETIPPADKLFWKIGLEELDELIASMSREELLAQLLILGWPSEYAEGEIIHWISRRNIGGVKIFGWNGNNVQTLAQSLSSMQELALSTMHGIPLFTATDQEGGWVRHIKDTTSITPGNLAIGASAVPLDSYLSGYYIASELRKIGVNMNFAPTVDVYSNKDAHVIGPRSFSSDPMETAILGTAFFQGMRGVGVIATAKHFPGHGNATADSHLLLPVIEDSLETLWERDLLPYRVMISDGLPAILSGHLNFPNIVGDSRPATLSKTFNTEILREKMGFEGILITDDLLMGAIQEYQHKQNIGLPEVIIEAMMAGNDMILLSQTPSLNDNIWEALIREYDSNPEFRRIVQNANRRILRVKMLYLKEKWRVPLQIDPQTISGEIQSREGKLFFQEQAARSITLLRNDLLPIRNDSRNILLISQDNIFLEEGKNYYPQAVQYYFDFAPFYWADTEVVLDLSWRLKYYDTIIFNLSNPNSLEVLKSMQEYADKIVVVSSLTPVYLSELDWVRTAIAIYGWGKESYRAGFAALRGDIEFSGSIPLDILVKQN